MRKSIAFLLCTIILCGMITQTSHAAAVETVQTTSIEPLSDGITIETTLTIHQSLLRNNSKRAALESVYKDNGTIIATVTLDATFGYDGTTAWVVSASASHWVASGWSYESQSLSTTGSTARVTATLKKWLLFISIASVPVDISLKCSPNGTIS